MCKPLLFLTAFLMLLAGPLAAQERERTYTVAFRSDVGSAQVVVPYPLEQVWRVLPQVYEAMGIPAGPTSDADAHEYMTPYLRVTSRLYGKRNSDFFTCIANSLGVPLADQGRLTFAMITRLEPTRDGQTAVLTQVDGRVQRRDVSSHTVECTTTGLLEELLAETLKLKLQQAQQSPPTPP